MTKPRVPLKGISYWRDSIANSWNFKMSIVLLTLGWFIFRMDLHYIYYMYMQIILYTYIINHYNIL